VKVRVCVVGCGDFDDTFRERLKCFLQEVAVSSIGGGT